MSVRTLIVDQWYRLAFSVLVAGITVAAVVLEFRINYVERSIGRYLTWHNAGRQEAGQIWETVSLSEEVQQQLDELVADRRAQVSLDEQVDDLVQLIQMAREREQVLLSRDRFLEIYNRMPSYQSALIIEPLQLLELIGSLEGWQRTLIEFEGGDMLFFLVDGTNSVLQERRLDADYVTFYMSGAGSRPFGRDRDDISAAEPYPPDVFYDAWAGLPGEQRSGIPLSNDELIAWRYRLLRVGVNLRNLVGERTEIAFELSGDQGLTTVRVLGRSLAVLHLVDEMNRRAGRPPIATDDPEGGGFIFTLPL
ncbi:MAG: hypothetical protein FVQ81_12855 [Candidatus Glassbacteria bacterium]|nr:hypothetical protein [Candidatus Glassbacteria bacterium]